MKKRIQNFKFKIQFILFSFLAIQTLTFHSCDYLNVNDYFNETLKYDSIWSKTLNVERYLFATAGLFPDEGDMFNSRAFATDEGFSLAIDNYSGMQYVLGNVSPTATKGAKWNNMYIIIRKANTILANIDKPTDITIKKRTEILGYTYFLRAYAYYHLLMQYGPLVIIGDDALETNEETTYYDRERETFDLSVDYICDELARAAESLPDKVALSYFGRPTRGAALGLIARLRLIQASPLWNGGSAAIRTYGSWKRSIDGVHYVSQTPDESKWATAAMACKRIIDMNTYSLHTVPKMPDTPPLPANVSDSDFPDGAGNIDPLRSYSDMFTGEAVMQRNEEYLWGRQSNSTNSFTRYSFPIINLGGYNNVCIPQKIIDAYRMADGKTIDESPNYNPNGFLGGSDRLFSGYRLKSSVSNMYVGREMRFYASIGFSECFWPCNSTSENGLKAQTVTYYADGTAGKQATGNNTPWNYPITGYTLKKFIHEDDAWAGNNAKQVQKSFPIIRYAEILLSYVEALNNLTTSHTITDQYGDSYVFTRNTEEMAKYFNMVRFRAGLPGLTSEELASVETMQSLIERERMVEFLFEDLRYYDVRRWGKYEQTENEPMMGMDTDAGRTDGYYTPVPINSSIAKSRVVNRKLILFPIELNEVRKSPSLDQNPGYQN